MKRVLSILISLCAIVSAYADVEIWTKDQLETFRDDVNNGNTYLNQTVKLMTDLDLGGTSESPISWEPIGKSETRWDEDKQESVKDDTRVFKGIFKGQGHTISMYVEDNRAVAGLFGYLYGTVQQLKVVGAISNSYKIGNVTYTSSTAGIAAYNRGTISECANFASIVGVYAGGIAGENHGIITNCYNRGAIGADATFTGEKYLGGIAGSNDGMGATISYVYASCSIDNVSSTGGITGNNISDGTVLYCYMASGMYNNGHGTTSELTGTTLNGQLNTTDDYTNWTFTDGELPELTCFKNKIVRLVDNYDNTAALSCNNGQMCTVELTNRTLYKDAAWNTLCLPFDIDLTNTANPLYGDGVVAKVLDGAKTSLNAAGLLSLSFNDAPATIPAGTPFIIKWNNTGEPLSNVQFSTVTISNTAPKAVEFNNYFGNKGQFVGTYSPFTIDESNIDEIVLLSGDNTLGYSKNTRTLRSCRAHFMIPTTTSQIRAMVDFEIDFDGTSGIISMEDGSSKMEDCEWYTLDGRKMDGEPTQPGVYIVNGKKVIVK